MIAGPNGAGKTTFARSFLPVEANVVRFLNADLIAAGLSPFAPEGQAARAGRLMLEEIRACVERGESFALETTLSGKGYLKHIAAWKAQGYRITLYFLSLPSAEMAISRVASRVLQGGHHIPDDVVRRRHALGWFNFEHHYRDAVDDWMLIDNRGDQPVVLDWKGKRMKSGDIREARNPDLVGAVAAIERAAREARRIAIRSETGIVIERDGVMTHVSADELRRRQTRDSPV